MAEQGTVKKEYPHISQGVREMLLSIGATSHQLETSDKNAKDNIDSTLARYLTDIPKVCIILVGDDGPGKDFIVGALLGENGCHSKMPADGPQSVTINGLEIIVVNTPGSWKMKVPEDLAEMMNFFVFVIDSKSQPTMPAELNQFEVEKVEEAICLGRFAVVDGQADTGAKEYQGENRPLYSFLKSDNIVHVDLGLDQTLGSTQQDIFWTMLLNAATSGRSSLEQPAAPNMQREETKGVAQEHLAPSEDAPKADDVIHTTSSDKSGGIAGNTTGEVPFDEKGDEDNLNSWEMIYTEESREAHIEPLITKLLDALQNGMNNLSDATSSSGIDAVVVGATGSGKSATANTLLGENKEEPFLEGSSAVSVTTERAEKFVMVNGVRLTVVDTPGSWEINHTPKVQRSKIVFVFVINLASPRFDLETLTKLQHVQDTEGNFIVKSGRFVVALSHADSALQSKTLEDYLEEIKGDPLHTFLTGDAKGKVIALNNAAETEYQRNEHQHTLLTRVLLASSKMAMPTSKSSLSGWWTWGTWIPTSIYNTASWFGSYL